MGFPADEISRQLLGIVAQPRLFQLNQQQRQVEFRFPLRVRAGDRIERRDAIVVYAAPEEDPLRITDEILAHLLEEAQSFEARDLILYAVLTNELLRSGPEGFVTGPHAIERARGKRLGELDPQRFLDFHRRMQLQANLAVYLPDGKVYISGRYYQGPPFRGGSLFNIGAPTTYLQTLAGSLIPVEWHVQPGRVGLFIQTEFGAYGTRPQFGLYPQNVLTLDSTRREMAIRMALYVAPLWRIRSGPRRNGREGELRRTWVPRHLFEAAGVPMPSARDQDRWLRRRGQDFDSLVDLRLLLSWRWEPHWAGQWAIAETPGRPEVYALRHQRRPNDWFNCLLDEGRLVLEPHPDLLREYAQAGLPEARRQLAFYAQAYGERPERPALPRTHRPLRHRQKTRS